MPWITIPQAPEWEYDNAPPDPGGLLTELWSTGVNGIRTTPFGQEIYMNCRHKILNPDAPSVPNEISKTFWDTYGVIETVPEGYAALNSSEGTDILQPNNEPIYTPL